MAVTGGLVYLYFIMNRILKQLAQPEIFTENAQTPEQVDKAPKSPDFRITEPDDTFRPKTGTTDSVEAMRFKTALKEMYAVDVAARKAAFLPTKRKLDLPLIATAECPTSQKVCELEVSVRRLTVPTVPSVPTGVPYR